MVTNDISNLINAIDSNPNDTTARLALADAYEETGNDSAAREQRTLANLTMEDRISALACHVECDPDDVEPIKYQGNGFEANGEEYLVLTDDEADKAARQEILDSVWAFNSTFVADHITVEDGSLISTERSIRAIQKECSEDCNGLLRAALDDEEEFVKDAISADGRGLFLAGYDHDENEVTYNGATLYIYRIN